MIPNSLNWKLSITRQAGVEKVGERRANSKPILSKLLAYFY